MSVQALRDGRPSQPAPIVVVYRAAPFASNDVISSNRRRHIAPTEQLTTASDAPNHEIPNGNVPSLETPRCRYAALFRIVKATFRYAS